MLPLVLYKSLSLLFFLLSLLTLLHSMDPSNREEATAIIIQQWKWKAVGYCMLSLLPTLTNFFSDFLFSKIDCMIQFYIGFNNLIEKRDFSWFSLTEDTSDYCAAEFDKSMGPYYHFTLYTSTSMVLSKFHFALVLCLLSLDTYLPNFISLYIYIFYDFRACDVLKLFLLKKKKSMWCIVALVRRFMARFCYSGRHFCFISVYINFL